jgi:hypothetical protein
MSLSITGGIPGSGWRNGHRIRRGDDALDVGPLVAGVVGAVVGASGDADVWWHDVNARLATAAPAASTDSRDPHSPAPLEGARSAAMQPSVAVSPVRNLTATATRAAVGSHSPEQVIRTL